MLPEPGSFPNLRDPIPVRKLRPLCTLDDRIGTQSRFFLTMLRSASRNILTRAPQYSCKPDSRIFGYSPCVPFLYLVLVHAVARTWRIRCLPWAKGWHFRRMGTPICSAAGTISGRDLCSAVTSSIQRAEYWLPRSVHCAGRYLPGILYDRTNKPVPFARRCLRNARCNILTFPQRRNCNSDSHISSAWTWGLSSSTSRDCPSNSARLASAGQAESSRVSAHDRGPYLAGRAS